MNAFIGERHQDRLSCGQAHLPGCYNPHLNVTACICGAAWWPGQVGTWHSVPRRAPEVAAPLLGIGTGAPGHRGVTEILGWDTYYLHAPDCRACDAECSPCGGAAASDYATAVQDRAA